MRRAVLIPVTFLTLLVVQALSAQQTPLSAFNLQMPMLGMPTPGMSLPSGLSPNLRPYMGSGMPWARGLHAPQAQAAQSSATSSSPYATGILSTIAGGNFNENGNTALNTGLGGVQGIVRDSSGNTYVAEGNIDSILKIDASGNVTVIAGTGIAGYSGDGGPATSALLNGPSALVLDNAGNLYFADTYNFVIRKINFSTGIISTIAGQAGQFGNSGDGGPATSAEIGFVYNLAFNPTTQSLYLADIYAGLVRQVSSTGTITTVAGSNTPHNCAGQTDFDGDGCPATSVALNWPSGIAVDAQGNLYIADWGEFTIRFVQASTGIISLYAGQAGYGGYYGDGGPATSATLYSPDKLTLDSAGNLYFTDVGGTVVREISAGIINTVAGIAFSTAAAGVSADFSGDGGPATQAQLYSDALTTDPTTNSLYIGGADRIRQLLSNGNIQTVAGNGFDNYFGNGGLATSAGIAGPEALAEDKAGNLYFVDTGNDVIRKINSNGIITTFAGTGEFGNAGDGGPATAASFEDITSLALDSSGNVYVSDAYTHSIRKINAATGIITLIAGFNEQLPTAFNCASAKDIVGDGCPATQAEMGYATSIAIDAAGNIYYANPGYDIINKITASTGILSRVAGTMNQPGGNYGMPGFAGDGGPATSAELNDPEIIALDKSGNLYIADVFNYRIREVVASTGVIQTIAGTGIVGYTGDGGPATSATFGSNIGGLFIDNAGDIYISDEANSAIREIDASGIISTVAGNGTYGFSGDGGPATSGEIDGAKGPIIDNSGRLVFSDAANQRIRAVTLAPVATNTTLISSNSSVTLGTPVTFTATVIPSTYGTPTGTVTFLDGTTPLGTGTLSGAIATYTTSALAVGAHSITAAYGGDASFSASTSASITQTIAGAPGFSFTPAAGGGTITVASGSTGTLSLTATALYGYTGAVTFICAPSAASFECSLTPSTVTFVAGGSTSQTITFTINASTSSTARLRPQAPFHTPAPAIFSAFAVWLPGSLLGLVGLRRRGKGKDIRKILWMLLLCIGLASSAGLMGCGSSGSSNIPLKNPPVTTSIGTPAGSYTALVTATSGSTQSNTTINITVN